MPVLEELRRGTAELSTRRNIVYATCELKACEEEILNMPNKNHMISYENIYRCRDLEMVGM